MQSSAPLSSTAYVILGFLDARPRTGYEIKRTVDTSTRFFWTASYGQIYPELRRLAEARLVAGERDDAGGRRRTRYRITASGRRELRRWLAEPAETYETRDEWLLKLFFARSAGKAGTESDQAEAAAAELIDSKVASHHELAEQLRSIEPNVIANGNPYQLSVLRCGIGINEWQADYWSRVGSELGRPLAEVGD